jgi:hypothetical protein
VEVLVSVSVEDAVEVASELLGMRERRNQQQISATSPAGANRANNWIMAEKPCIVETGR